MDDKNNRTGGLTETDRALWERFSEDIRPIRRNVSPSSAPHSAPKRRKAERAPKQVESTPPSSSVQDSQPRGKGIDGSIARDLRQGKKHPEAKLDLHGKTQDQAQKLIVDFILASQRDGKRLVLVVTGTGEKTRRPHDPDDIFDAAPGVLRRRFHDFINQPQIRDIVLHTQTAHKRHGGAGAFYVYLRRQDRMP